MTTVTIPEPIMINENGKKTVHFDFRSQRAHA